MRSLSQNNLSAMSRVHRRFLGVIASLALTAGCHSNDWYIEPHDLGPQAAVVSGPISMIDYKPINSATTNVNRGDPILVSPGSHRITFAEVDLVAPIISSHTRDISLDLDLKPGKRYEFKDEYYLNISRLRMTNVTEQRTTFYDMDKLVVFDETGKYIPTPPSGYSP